MKFTQKKYIHVHKNKVASEFRTLIINPNASWEAIKIYCIFK